MVHVTSDTEPGQTQQPSPDTELVFRKDGETVVIFGLVDGEQILHMEPNIKRSSSAMKAAVQTFVGRAFDAELNDNGTEGAFK